MEAGPEETAKAVAPASSPEPGEGGADGAGGSPETRSDKAPDKSPKAASKSSTSSGEDANTGGEVVIFPLTGMVSEAQFYFLRRSLKAAEARGAKAFVLEMSTFGGELKGAEEIARALSRTKLETVTYITAHAGSAGALIALSTDKIYMAPVSAVGAAAPVSVGPSGEVEKGTDVMREKIESYFSGFFRSVAEENGHHPELADAFIRIEKEVKIGDEVIKPAGELLTLSAAEALRQVGGRTLFSNGTADTREEMLAMAGLTGSVSEAEPTGFESVAAWIAPISGLFLILGLVCAYIEFKTPGIGLPAILSGLCFLVYFTSRYWAGMSGWEWLFVFLIGFGLVLVELLFFPGVVVVALAGVALMGVSLLRTFLDRYPGESWMPRPDELLMPFLQLSAAVLISGLIMVVLAKFLPTAPGLRRLVLKSASVGGAVPEFSAMGLESGNRIGVGAIGHSLTMLRPAGRAQFENGPFDVVSDGQFVARGVEIRVIQIEGGRIVVAPVG